MQVWEVNVSSIEREVDCLTPPFPYYFPILLPPPPPSPSVCHHCINSSIIQEKYSKTRSLGGRWALTSSLCPFGPAFAPFGPAFGVIRAGFSPFGLPPSDQCKSLRWVYHQIIEDCAKPVKFPTPAPALLQININPKISLQLQFFDDHHHPDTTMINRITIIIHC